MTSTTFTIGLKEDGRVSSRVQRPPGGAHTDIFGGEPEPLPTGRRRQFHQHQDQVQHQHRSTIAEEPPTNGTDKSHHVEKPEPVHEQPKPVDVPKPEVPVQEPVKAAEAQKEPAVPQPQKPEPAKRIRVPPGGFSSGLW